MMKRTDLLVSLWCICLAFFAAGCSRTAATAGIGDGDMFTDISVDTPKGALSDYVGRGRFTLVCFWASWSGPSVQELKILEDVRSVYTPDELTVLAFAVCDTPAGAAAAAARMAPSVPAVAGETREAADAYGLEHLPVFVLFGPDGTVLKSRLRGRAVFKVLRKTIAPQR